MTKSRILDDSLEACAPSVGPFPHAPFLVAAERAVGRTPEEVRVFMDGLGAVAMVVDDNEVRFAGDGFITDYHAPLGGDPVPSLVEAFNEFSGARYDLDSLPEEAADVIRRALDRVGASGSEEVHAATVVYSRSTQGWLSDIGKKQRHEVRRKRRNLEAALGPVSLAVAGAEDVSRFCEVHRSNSDDKEAFMTSAMEAFFAELVETAGARIHNLVAGDRVLASAFGFPTAEAYYLYNSAYDTDIADLAPGAVLLGYLIEHHLARGVSRFDFLKGDETYKRRHGGLPRPLHRFTGTLP